MGRTIELYVERYYDIERGDNLADITSNYKLNKPLRNENINIDVLNQNMDIIDTNLKSLSDKTSTSVQSVKIGTTEYKSGNTVTLPNYPTTLPASDVPSWAKQNTKPTYTASEVGALPNTAKLSDFGVTASIDEYYTRIELYRWCYK